MVAHRDKSETMKVGSKHALKKECEVDIYLDITKLKEVSSYKYLGEVVDSSLGWPSHIDYICKNHGS